MKCSANCWTKRQAGDNVGVLLRGTKREDVERGQVLAKPGTITPHTKFKAEVYVLSKEEGGRHTPFFANYRPQFYFRTTDVISAVTLEEGVEMVMPGENVTITVELIAPIAMEEGLRFAIREGGRTVGLKRGFFCYRLSLEANSSIGRVSVSKTEGWGFETLLACQIKN